MFFFIKICLCFLATYCTANSTGKLHLREKQFIHSLNQAYALGLNDYTFGVYRSYENGSIGSSMSVLYYNMMRIYFCKSKILAVHA